MEFSKSHERSEYILKIWKWYVISENYAEMIKHQFYVKVRKHYRSLLSVGVFLEMALQSFLSLEWVVDNGLHEHCWI